MPVISFSLCYWDTKMKLIDELVGLILPVITSQMSGHYRRQWRHSVVMTHLRINDAPLVSDSFSSARHNRDSQWIAVVWRRRVVTSHAHSRCPQNSDISSSAATFRCTRVIRHVIMYIYEHVNCYRTIPWSKIQNIDKTYAHLWVQCFCRLRHFTSNLS